MFKNKNIDNDNTNYNFEFDHKRRILKQFMDIIYEQKSFLGKNFCNFASFIQTFFERILTHSNAKYYTRRNSIEVSLKLSKQVEWCDDCKIIYPHFQVFNENKDQVLIYPDNPFFINNKIFGYHLSYIVPELVYKLNSSFNSVFTKNNNSKSSYSGFNPEDIKHWIKYLGENQMYYYFVYLESIRN